MLCFTRFCFILLLHIFLLLLFLVQVARILEKHEPSRCSSGAFSFLSGHHGSGGGSAALRLGPIPADEASAVQNYVEHMLFLLMEEEAGRGGSR